MTGEFRGLTYAPSYEAEVIMLFGMILPHLNDSFEIDEYNDEFPDCSAKMNGKLVGIEFELNASHFKEQKHHLDPRLPNCDFLICWKNDVGKDSLTFENKEIRIIELSKEIDLLEKRGLKFILNPEKRKHPISKWERETFLKQLWERVEDGQVTNNEYNLIEDLLIFCEKNKELEVVYGVGSIASLSVRVKKWGKISPFGAMANGVVWISFKDANKSWVYPSKEIEAELRRRFNQPSGYYKNYHVRDNATLCRIKEALIWLAKA
jgi:hypothetical protein